MTTNKQALFAALTLPLMAALAGCGGIAVKEQAPDAGAAAQRMFYGGTVVFLNGDEGHSVCIPAGFVTTERKQGDITVPVIRLTLMFSGGLKEVLKAFEELAAQSGREFSVYDASNNGSNVPVSADIAYWVEWRKTTWMDPLQTIIELRGDVFSVRYPWEHGPIELY